MLINKINLFYSEKKVECQVELTEVSSFKRSSDVFIDEHNEACSAGKNYILRIYHQIRYCTIKKK